MRKLAILASVVFVVLSIGVTFAVAKGRDRDDFDARTSLNGYNEVLSISTPARGSFRAEIEDDSIEYRLRYEGFPTTVTASHIHFAQRHTNGGISAFLCGGGDKPACPANAGTVEGTIDAADVIGPADRGIAAGEFAELVRAIKAGATYVNVHSMQYPPGEIRGQLKARRKHDRD